MSTIDEKFPICPSQDWSCPYYGKYTCRCMMYDEEGVTPYEECDNFFDMEEEEEDEE